MSAVLLSDHYRPPRLAKGKEWMIRYRVKDPVTGIWRQKKEKLNDLRRSLAPREFNAYVQQRMKELHTMLCMGWNPFRDGDSKKVGKPLEKAVEDFLAAKQREGRRKDTMRSYRSNAEILLRWVRSSPTPQLSCGGFTEQHAKEYMRWSYTHRELCPKTFNNIHTFYITLWNWMVYEEYCGTNVFRAVKKKEIDPESGTKRPPTTMERAAIKLALEVEHPRFYAFCLLCFHCGIRPKEIFMLRPFHFDLRGQSILVERQVAKNKRTMGVAIPDVLLPYLVGLEMEKQNLDHYVFSTDFKPGPVLKNSRYSGKAWDRLRRKIGLSKEVSNYQLKHAGGEQLSRDGVSAVDLMNHLRHHDLSETSTYIKRATRGGVRDVIHKASSF